MQVNYNFFKTKEDKNKRNNYEHMIIPLPIFYEKTTYHHVI